MFWSEPTVKLGSMGASSASYLCYGAYGGSILFGILEIINLYRAFRPKTQDSDRAEGVKNDAILQDAALIPRLSPNEANALKEVMAERLKTDAVLQKRNIEYLNSQIDALKQISPLTMLSLWAKEQDQYNPRLAAVLREEILKMRALKDKS